MRTARSTDTVLSMGAAEKILEEAKSLTNDEREKLGSAPVQSAHSSDAHAELAYWTKVIRDEAKASGANNLSDDEIEAEIQAVRSGR